jgi:hypothetical protein
MSQLLKRRHLRAPLRFEFLYEDEGHVLKGKIKNISEGGILLSEISKIPAINRLPVLIPITHYPEFSQLGTEKLLSISNDHRFPKTILRMRAKIVRTFKGQSDAEKVFVDNIGCEFVTPSENDLAVVRQYVSIFARNVIYMLNLFENAGRSKETVECIRKMALLFGYQEMERLPLLRQKLLHDYQSLESL